jgi:putative addiction module killer protein
VIEVLETEVFVRWMANLRDPVAKVRIAGRLRQLAFGLLGDVRSVGEGISELRVHVGPGYRGRQGLTSSGYRQGASLGARPLAKE